jgi:3-hydroxyisobutyrate dehydrogenase
MVIGFVGLGTMGASMALNVRAAGYDLIVHDRRPEAGAPHVAAGSTWSASLSDLASRSDVVLTSLPGPREIEAVAMSDDGLLAHMRPGATWIDLSTSSPELMRSLHARFAERRVEVLDAPVSGGPSGARTRKLALWVGGTEAEFQRLKRVLDAIGDQVLYIGPIGAGSVAKLVHNCASFAIQTVLAEVFTLGVKAGVDPLALWLAVRQGAQGRQRTFDRLAEQFLPNQYEPPAFALGLAHKDVALATELARELNVPMRLSALAFADMTEAMNRGWAGLDSRVSMRLQTERSGVDIQVPREQIEDALRAAK